MTVTTMTFQHVNAFDALMAQAGAAVGNALRSVANLFATDAAAEPRRNCSTGPTSTRKPSLPMPLTCAPPLSATSTATAERPRLPRPATAHNVSRSLP
jgi:hypothetical protein